MLKFVLIFIGSGLGGVLRYALGGWVQRLGQGTFPVGTLAVNVSGCLLIGFLTALLSGPVLIRDEYRLALLIGVLGGYTTFSTFGWETFSLVNEGQIGQAVVNAAASVGAGVAAVWIGYRLAETWRGV